jgi:AraC family transcriptional regulator, transcriptional activator for feuABC-ybbA operon
MSQFQYILENINLNILLGNLNIRVVTLVKVEPHAEWTVPNHSHSDFEFHIIPRGKGYLDIEGTKLKVGGGEFYVTGPYIQHRQVSDRADPMAEYCLECEINLLDTISPEYVPSPMENRLLRETLSKSWPVIFQDTLGVASLFEEIFREAAAQEPGYLLHIQSQILLALSSLFRVIVSQENTKPVYTLPVKSVDELRLRRLLMFIEMNYKSSITQEDASRVLFLSPRQMNRLLKKKFNMTFHEYLLQHRLQNAKKLLEDTDLSIEEVAYEAGFSSHFYMYQVFRHFGLPTPALVRKDS